jgi:hypothetical protein
VTDTPAWWRSVSAQMGERGRLPFDVQAIGTVKFRRDEVGLIDARNKLAALPMN